MRIGVYRLLSMLRIEAGSLGVKEGRLIPTDARWYDCVIKMVKEEILDMCAHCGGELQRVPDSPIGLKDYCPECDIIWVFGE